MGHRPLILAVAAACMVALGVGLGLALSPGQPVPNVRGTLVLCDVFTGCRAQGATVGITFTTNQLLPGCTVSIYHGHSRVFGCRKKVGVPPSGHFAAYLSPGSWNALGLVGANRCTARPTTFTAPSSGTATIHIECSDDP